MKMQESYISTIILILLYLITLSVPPYPSISLSHKKIILWEFSGVCGN